MSGTIEDIAKKWLAEPAYNKVSFSLFLLRTLQNRVSFLFFLDTQVSLAPTHVSKSVGWSVGWSVSKSYFRISNLWSPFCATVVFEDPTAMLLGSPPSPRRSTPSPRRSTPSPRRSTPSLRRSTPSPSFFQNCR